MIQVFLCLSFKSVYKGGLEIVAFSMLLTSGNGNGAGSLCSLRLLLEITKIPFVLKIYRLWQQLLCGAYPCAQKRGSEAIRQSDTCFNVMGISAVAPHHLPRGDTQFQGSAGFGGGPAWSCAGWGAEDTYWAQRLLHPLWNVEHLDLGFWTCGGWLQEVSVF